MQRSIDISSLHGVIDAYILTPQDHSGPLPPVILFTDIAGLRECYITKAQRIADAGYAVLLPNIYYRTARGRVLPEEGVSQDTMAMLFQHANLLTPEALRNDFAAHLETIGQEPEFADGKIGAIGYCLTGSFPIWMASQFSDRVAAAAGFHAAGLADPDNPLSILGVIPSVKAQVYFGHADRDQYLDAAQIALVDEALASASVHFASELYKGAEHGFTVIDFPAYNQLSDAMHFKRIFTLLEETLSP